VRIRSPHASLLCAIALSLLSCHDATAPVPSGPAATITVTAGTNLRARVGDTIPTPLTFTVRDASGTTVAGVVLSFAELRDSVFSEVGRSTTAADGVARFAWRLSAPTGQKVLRARPGDGRSAIEALVTATALAPAGTEVTRWNTLCCPTAYRSDSLGTQGFRVTNNGVPLSGVRVTFSTGLKGGTVAPSFAISGADGVAMTRFWKVGVDTGTYQLYAVIDADSAAAPSRVHTADTLTARVLSFAPASLTLVAGGDQRIPRGLAATPIVVRVTDSVGVGVRGIHVTWSLPAQNFSNSIGSCDALTNDAGLATMPCGWIAKTLGAYDIIVSAGTLRSVVTFVVVQPPTSIAFLTAPPSSARTSTYLGDTVSVVVRFADGSPAAGVPVQFSASPLDPDKKDPLPAVTDARGIASTRWLLSEMPGVQTLGARVTLNGTGVTGDGITVLSTTLAVNSSGPLPFSALAAGGAHTCGQLYVYPMERLFCWGRNASGQLMDGTKENRRTPVRSPFTGNLAYNTLITLSAGAEHTCVSTSTPYFSTFHNESLCAGSNASLQLGKIGSDQSLPQTVGSDLARVSAGVAHSCAMTINPDRSVTGIRCWGDNTFGALGDGSTTTSVGATVQLPVGKRFVSVSAGDGYTCALASASDVWCWGRNDDGQLGDGTRTNRLVPVPVSGTLRFDTTFAIIAGGGYACGRAAAGSLYCWGRNDAGQLGDGTLAVRTEPTAVAGMLSIATASAGGSHTCAITITSATYCWGNNASGQLGIGTSVTYANTPQLVGGQTFRAIAAGSAHTCALAVLPAYNSPAWCWGANADGQLGDGTTTNRATPVAVSDYRP
jgi:alpha-tubulin suppressor-like RCC1 family protein